MTLRADIVTVFHNERNYRQHLDLRQMLVAAEPEGGFTFIAVDNRVNNRGFAAGCNAGAFMEGATAPIIGFINPDATVTGPFLNRVAHTLRPPIVITGCRFSKAQRELNAWGVSDWVCGAAMFVARDWFSAVGGFDTGYIWSWEETDLIRQAQRQGLQCRSIDLPIAHVSPDVDDDVDATYKRTHFEHGAQRFNTKWRRHPAQVR